MNPIRSVDLVIPVYNEEEALPLLLEALRRDLAGLEIPWRAVLVDDGSHDRSWQIMQEAARRDPRILAIGLARNYGQHAAVFAGLAACEADAVVTLDADLQNPPAEIPRLIAALDAGADVVGGWRQVRHDNLLRRVASRAMNRLISRATGVELRDYGCMLRAYRIEIVRLMCQSAEISSYIPALAHCFTDRVVEIPVAHAERAASSSRYSLMKLFALLLDLLTGFSMFSLRALSGFGIAMAGLGALFGVGLVVMRLVLGSAWAVQGVFTLFALLFMFVGAQFVALGLLGEYLGRIYDQVRRRPRYVIRAEVGRTAEAAADKGGAPRALPADQRPRAAPAAN
jgi:undecaprenyl-phosphate 4-deoxy-4-formamido-L-arabinose transferase